ncbi:putative uncharacterized protein [Parachlamydia acanthamoebae UV-7]|jgi:hypothetical protein|uniref:Uncharacterized protein n=2 Tax=Parachlamydia acanthamoebae TaxID=83552 RepID=F8KYT5_PARAV|nr:hypothetical protein [Parachlamydia acanthamoebae]EFB41089.1 hypothetical protein pah_c050o044 [Parachlamydia acanthamoebae str. Hall's coccus]KIA78195.1 hypothetical protein DB43_EL00060 [Parachlamydia acanthamoebae]CCB86044.1 putative uncharacterized protein [Parachlamydia acanthamoebae UV-7]
MGFKNILFILISGLNFTTIAFGLDIENNPYQLFKDAAINSTVGTPWKAKKHQELIQQVTAARPDIVKVKTLAYPISEENLKELYGNQTSVPFFAYSSLIDKGSPTAKTISSQALETLTPAVAFGIQRVFNREMPSNVAEKWGNVRRSNDVAVLNAFVKNDAVLNGVLLQLPLPDLLTLTKGEVGYDLMPVLVVRWNDALDESKPAELILAYTLIAPDYKGTGDRYTNDKINPIPGYVKFLQNGLKNFGEDYEAMWWATTFLADKKTLINEMPDHEVNMALETINEIPNKKQ